MQKSPPCHPKTLNSRWRTAISSTLSTLKRHETYVYSPLNEEAQEIRLLTLLPGTFSSKIRLTLDITPFTESHTPDFEAVSYTWGSTKHPVNIFIGESGRNVLTVTRNLGKALPYLRYEDRPRVLWIDAVCVDQKNLKERGHQVKRMAEIFSRARRVLVWLGPESDSSPLALHVFQEIATHVEFDESTMALTATTDEAHWADYSLTLPFNGVELLSVSELLHRPWFERLWIWQEVHLASGDIGVMVGRRTIAWTTLKLAVMCLFLKPTPYFGQAVAFRKRLDAVFDLCDWRGDYSIDSLFDMTKHCFCSDQRDKIYALLSLLPNSSEIRIEPDYTKSVYQTYQDATISLIECSNAMDILGVVGSHDHLEGVPSWVPNLMSPQPSRPFILGDASTSSPHCLPIEHGSGVLKVEGVIVAVIKQVEPMPFFDRESSRMEEVRGLMAVATRIGFQRVPFQSPQHQAFTRTISANNFRERVSPDRLWMPTVAQSETAVYRILTTDIDDKPLWKDPDFEQVMDNCRYLCRGRSFYVTGDGVCGLAPLAAKQGDIVTVLLGCNAAMILHQNADGSYKLIGAAYCDGFTNGEALLGSLSESFEAIWRNGENAASGEYGWQYLHSETGKFQVEDPRKGPLPPGWQIKSHEKDQLWHWFVNEETGEKTWNDPRLTSKELRKRGVPLQVFNLV